MKNSVIRKKIFIITAIVCVIAAIVFAVGDYAIKKSYATDSGIKNIASFIDIDDNPTSASFIVENIFKNDKNNIDGFSYEITSNNGTTIDVSDINSNESLIYDSKFFNMDENGVLVKVDNILKGNTYTIKIQPTNSKKGYRHNFKYIEIELDYTDGLSAHISKIVDSNNEEVNVDENEQALFLFTDDDNKIHLRANENTDIYYYYSLNDLDDNALNDIDFVEYDKENYLSIATNGYLYAKSKYKTSGYSKITKLHINNIDKLNPVITVNSVEESATKDSAIINYNLNDQEETKEYGKSGIKSYYIDSIETISDNLWNDITDTDNLTYETYDNGVYYIHTKDNAGNTTTQKVDVDCISNESLDYVLIVLESPYQELNGQLFNSFNQMQERFRELNVTSNDHILAQVINNINNQVGIIENVDLKLDLNGYEIKSRKEQSNLIVKPNAKLTIVDNKYSIDNYKDNYTATNFDYINGESEFVAPKTGSYKLEVWGASGGSNDYTRGGYGGYSVGYVNLNENDKLYVNVGGQGTGGSTSTAGYNGGGTANHSGSWTRGAGGGATHIALESGLLSTFEDKKDKVLIVAGGGGGAGYYNGSEMSNGGDAGGFEGKTGNGTSSNQTQGAGGTQTAAGTGYEDGAFGQGANRTTTSDFGGSGGGAGWYGGGASMNTAGGGGGSSYIGNELLTRKAMYCFKCTESTDESTKTISKNTYSEDHLANTPKVGNGYAIISILTSTFADPTADYSMYHSNDDTGKITNSTSSAIMVEEGGVLQIGEDNSPDLVHIEYPNHVSPYIFGERYGIYNNGTFNYYDGVLVGGNSFRGDINDTPPLYDPYVTKDNNNHYYVATLEEVSGVEALIGKTRYTLLENAIAAANNTVGTTNDQIEIDIIKDLAKDDSVYINSNKNIILDLNSHTFTNTASKPVIDNTGRTSIKDSIGGGKITSDSSHAILNSDTGHLEINDIDVYSANRDIASIMNKNNGELIVNSGKIYNTGEIHNSRGGTVLYNDGGDLTINGGDFTIYNDDWLSTIYNKDAVTDIYESDIPIELYDIQNESGAFSWYPTKNYEKRNGILEVGDYSDNTFETSGYYYIDLSNYNAHEQFTFTINVDCNAHWGSPYAYYRTDDARQDWNQSIDGNRFMYIWNEDVQGGEYSAKLAGGKKYKVHISYFRNNGSHSDEEYFSINSVRLVKNVTYIGRVTINDGLIHDGQYGLYNDSLFDKTIINGGTFDGKNNIYNVFNRGEIHINGGTFTRDVNNYNIMYITGGEFNDLYNLRDNNKDGTLYISGGTTKTLHNGTYSDDNKTYITGGTFYGIYNFDYMDIKNAAITGFLNIQEHADEMYIDNTNIISNSKENGVRELVYTRAHTPLHISNSTLEINNYDKSYVLSGIVLDYDADFTMDNSTLKVINQAETYYEYNNIGIHSKGGNVTLNNSSVDVTSTNAKSTSYGIYYQGENIITIGSKDGDYSKQSSHVYGTNYGIHNTHGLINFYDGYVLSDNQAVCNSIHDIETNYYVKRDTEDGKEIVYLKNDIYNIIDVDTNIQYHTLKEALAAVGDTANLKYISTYNYETSLDPYTLSSSKNITIDINGSTVYLGNGIVNNGILKFIDTANTKGNIYSQYIINNNKLDIDGGNWLIEWDKDYGILNNGIFVVSNSIIDSVYNEKDKYVINNNGTFTLSTNGELKQKGGGTKLIYNNYTGKVYFTAGTVNQYGETAYALGEGKVVYNEGGYVETTNTIMNVDSSGPYSAVHKRPFYNKSCTVDDEEKRATMKIIGTTFNDPQHHNYSGMIVGYNSDIEVVDGTFNGNGITTHENSTLYIHDGTFTYGTAIISDNSEVTIDNATVNSTDDNGVWFGENVKLTINDINITATQRGIDFAGYGAWGRHDNSDIVINKATVTTSGKIGIEIGSPNTLLLSNTTVNVLNETDRHTDIYGIYFADGSYYPGPERGTITISNSTIKATATGERMRSYGLFIDDYLGTVNLTNSDGDEDGNVSETSSYIYGDTYGIYRTNGTFNYYDGILRGETQLYGGVNDIPKDYVLYYGEDTESKYVILKKVYVARNTDTDTSYSNVQDAFNACTDDVECNIEMLYDVNLPAKLEVDEHKIINLDLNEKKILETYDKFIENKGKLTITNGTITTESVLKEQALIDNYNELIISTGAIIKVDGVDNSRTLYNRTDAKLYINDGIVYSTGGYDYNYNGKVLYNNGGYVEINGGTITGDSGYNNFNAIDNRTVTIDNVEHRGKIVINGGTIKKGSDGRYINAVNSDVEMHGGTMTQTVPAYHYSYGIVLTENATLYATNGTIEKFDAGIQSENSTVTIDYIILDNNSSSLLLYRNVSVIVNDILVRSGETAISLYGSNGVTVNKGTFESNNRFISAGGFNKDVTVNLNNVKATITGNGSGMAAGIFVDTFNGLTANISNSEIIATNPSGKAAGIYIDNIRDEEDDIININISNNNDEVETTKSLIYGDTYGIYSDNHYVNFYDGVIKGATPIHGVINNRPTNYNIYYDTDSDGKNEIYLKEFDVVKNVDTNINYETIQAAFDACEDNTLCNLKLLYNIMPEDVTTVKANKKINFDLNEHNILLPKKKGFVVNGELKLTNGRIHSQSRNDGYYFIENNGKLELGTGFELYNDYLPETKLLKNNYTGNVYINGALLLNTVSGNYISGKIIYNEGGYVEINSGTIEGYTASWKCAVNDIYNTNKTVDETVHEGHIVLNGGKIHDNHSDYSYYIINNVGAKFTMNGGEIYSAKGEVSSTAIHGQDNATIIINNGLIHDNSIGVYVNNSNLTMTGEKIYNNYLGIKSESSTVSINEGLLKDNNTGIHIVSDGSRVGETTLTDSTITATENAIKIEGNNNLNILSGNYTATGEGSNGLLASGTGIITIGTNDGVVSISDPHITGVGHGLNITNDDSTVKFYDGIITSNNTIIGGQVDETPTDYIVSAYDSTSYILRIKSDIQDTFEYKGIYFQDIDMPIDMIANSNTKQGTINLRADVVLTKGITIPADIDVTIALYGHTISFNDINIGITNNGTLTIIDGSLDQIDNLTDSRILNQDGTVIVNNGTLTIGAENNPNSQSPKIIGSTGYSGNTPTVKSGYIESTSTNTILNNLGAVLSSLFEPSYSYVHKEYEVFNVNDDVALTSSPLIKSKTPITTISNGIEFINWTNQNVDVGLTTHNYGVLNLVSEIDPNEKKEITYRIEVYKNEILDEFSSKNYTEEVQYLTNTINVDFDWFDNAEHKFKDYTLVSMIVNNNNTRIVPSEVEDGTVIKLYYVKAEKGEVKGVELINPKTGRKTYIKAFIAVLSLLIISISFLLYRQRKLNKQ